MTQTPNTKPGAYYVSVRKGGMYYKLLGPFLDDHAAALARVDDVRRMAEGMNPRCAFYSFGTLRTDEPRGPGSLNKYFDMETTQNDC